MPEMLPPKFSTFLTIKTPPTLTVKRFLAQKIPSPKLLSRWPAGECWEPDKVFAQIQAGLLNAKSIGWLPTKAHFADVKEAAKNNWREGTLVVEEWLLIEYAVGTIPVNPETVVEVVSKTIKPDNERSDSSRLIPFITLEELEKSLANRINCIDVEKVARGPPVKTRRETGQRWHDQADIRPFRNRHVAQFRQQASQHNCGWEWLGPRQSLAPASRRTASLPPVLGSTTCLGQEFLEYFEEQTESPS
jgi:hypothetical protein